MSKIAEATNGNISMMHDVIERSVDACATLEQAAQNFTDILYRNFEESIVLTRVFATVPYRELPPSNQNFVDDLADSAGIASLIKDRTLVLSLLGSRGEKATWNSRHDSEGHVGIPLASADFIESIPMMARLLKELGLGLDWIDNPESEFVAKKIGKMAGVFYVPDAAASIDHKGRKIIAGQDFVDEHGVQTVFGLGGGYLYLGSNTFLVNVVFTREAIEKRRVVPFVTVLNTFKTATVRLDAARKIFA